MIKGSAERFVTAKDQAMNSGIGQLVERYLNAPRFPDDHEFRALRGLLLEHSFSKVQSEFEQRMAVAGEDELGRLIERFAILYRTDSLGLLARWLEHDSSTIRWLVCGCLHDVGDARVLEGLRRRMFEDSDCQVRVEATGAVGRLGTLDVLPDLERVLLNDREVDCLGYSPSWTALSAITDQLRFWTSRQIQGHPAASFEESFSAGFIRGVVLGQGIQRDPDGRLLNLPRYSVLPRNAFGHGLATKLNLATTLQPLFEVWTTACCGASRFERIFIYEPLVDDTAELDCAIHTIIDVASCIDHLRSSP